MENYYYFSPDCRGPLPTEPPEYIVYSPSANITCTNPEGCPYEEDYVYEYDASDSFKIPLEEVIPSGIVYGIILLVGVIGNALVIFSIARFRMMQNVTNIFLTSLASADLLLILICVPIKFVKFFSYTWEFGHFLCKFVNYMMNVSAICSVLTLTSMSVERYYAILHPMRAKYKCTPSRARRVIIVLWFLSFVLAIPILIGQLHEKIGVDNPKLEELDLYWCIKRWSKCIVSQLYEIYMLLLVLIIPLAIMSMAYASICRELWVVTSQRISMTSGNGSVSDNETSFSNSAYGGNSSRRPMLKKKAPADDDKTRKQGSEDKNDKTETQNVSPMEDKLVRQVIKMLVAVIVLFGICWGPFLVDNVMVAFGYIPMLHHGPLKALRILFSLLTYVNSCVNPVVYAFMSKNFRQSFKYALCSCIHGKNYARRHRFGTQASFQTRTTSLSRGISLKTEVEYDKSVFSDSVVEDAV